jgi:hypothetical protein
MLINGISIATNITLVADLSILFRMTGIVRCTYPVIANIAMIVVTPTGRRLRCINRNITIIENITISQAKRYTSAKPLTITTVPVGMAIGMAIGMEAGIDRSSHF